MTKLTFNGRMSVRVIVDIALWLAVGLPGIYLFLRGVPVERGFHCDDQSLSYPNKPDTISTPVLILVGSSTAIIVTILVELFNYIDGRCRHTRTDSIKGSVKAYVVFLFGFGVEVLMVEIVKNQMGSLRPNFFSVCQPDYNRTLCPGYITEYMCTGSLYMGKEGREVRQSFPSGHAAFSMYIAVYYCMYIYYRLDVSFSRILKFLLQSGLVGISLVCGFQRISDNKHHMSDVMAGFAFGMGVAIAVFVLITKRSLVQGKRYDCRNKEQITSDSDEYCTTCCTSLASENEAPSAQSCSDHVTHSGRALLGVPVKTFKKKGFEPSSSENLCAENV